jgi:hypothetical protein
MKYGFGVFAAPSTIFKSINCPAVTVFAAFDPVDVHVVVVPVRLQVRPVSTRAAIVLPA